MPRCRAAARAGAAAHISKLRNSPSAPAVLCGMSRHTTLAAFLATLAVVVPAAWRSLDADISSDGPLLRPKQATLHTGGAAVSVELDRGVLLSGGRLKVTLVGTADTARKIALDVRALQDNGMGPERVENPPTEVARRRITIEAAPGGGKPTELTFDLGPRRARPGRMEWFDIDVTPAGKRGDDVSYYGSEEEPATAAKVGAVVWSGNTLAMTLEAPERIPAGGEPFPVKLRIKNTTRQPIDYVDIRLGGPSLSFSPMEGLTFYGDDSYDVERVESTEDGDGDESIAPGAERVYEYQVTPHGDGGHKLGLLVQAGATVVLDERKNKYLYLGAMETAVIEQAAEAPADEAARTAGKRAVGAPDDDAAAVPDAISSAAGTGPAVGAVAGAGAAAGVGPAMAVRAVAGK
jgi:hypothetical protein